MAAGCRRWRSSRRNCSARGSSSRCRRPKTCKNRFVVPYSNGRPKSSARPQILTNSRSINCRNNSPHCTPRTASISARSTGCRYATIAKVSIAGELNRTNRLILPQFPQPRSKHRPRKQLVSAGQFLDPKCRTRRIVQLCQASNYCTRFSAIGQVAKLSNFSTRQGLAC